MVVQDDVGCSHERNRRHDHLVPVLPAISLLQRSQSDMESACSAVTENGIATVVQLCKLPFEALRHRSIGKPVGGNDLVQVVLLSLTKHQPSNADLPLGL